MLAFVYSWLDEHDLMAVRTEAETYLMMAALNLVEFVAFVGATEAKAIATGTFPSSRWAG